VSFSAIFLCEGNDRTGQVDSLLKINGIFSFEGAGAGSADCRGCSLRLFVSPGAAVGPGAAYIGLVQTGGPWDPKTTLGRTRANVAAGNINFGATCSRFGFNTWLGRVAQIADVGGLRSAKLSGGGIARCRNSSATAVKTIFTF